MEFQITHERGLHRDCKIVTIFKTEKSKMVKTYTVLIRICVRKSSDACERPNTGYFLDYLGIFYEAVTTV